MIGQNDGFENEKQLVVALNEKQIQRLSAYQQEFIKAIYQNVSDKDVVQAKKSWWNGIQTRHRDRS